jgi:hypothetical protein
MKGQGLEHEVVSTSMTQHDQKGFPVVQQPSGWKIPQFP